MLVVGGVITAIISALGAYLLAARRMSGRIETSSAKELWDEAAAIRTDYREQNAGLRRRVTELEVAAEVCRGTIAHLEATIRDFQRKGPA